MEIILSNPKRTYSEIISLREINKVNGNIKQFASKKCVYQMITCRLKGYLPYSKP